MKEILDFCRERNLLLEGSICEVFSEYDFEKVKNLIENIKEITNKRFIGKDIFLQYFDEIIERSNNLFNIEELFIIKEKIKGNLNDDFYKKDINIISSFFEEGKKIEIFDFVDFFNYRYNKMIEIIQKEYILDNLNSIGKALNSNQRCSIIGMVFEKNKTKNGNIIFEIEDLTGTIKVIVSHFKKDLFLEAEDISLDSVLGFVGTIKGEFMFLEKIIFPDSNLDCRKRYNLDENIIFIGDIHFGSKKFMKEEFMSFIDFLNSDNEDAKKIKYLFIVGDLVYGIGKYPNQNNDLEILDFEEQFVELSKILKKIKRDINIVIMPGNHDGIRLMEPQPRLNKKYAKSIIEMDNVISVENPSYLRIGENENFKGFDILCYHGFSFPYYYNNIPSLLSKKAINDPIKIMKYLLKNRHLAPAHSSIQYFPGKKDFMLIENVPDFFVSGHTHKSGISYYNNIMVVSVSSWERITKYQEKLGNNPDYCKVPMVNLKTRTVKILDFEGDNNGC